MNAGEVTWQEEHAEPDAQEDEKVELRTFKVFYAVTTPGIATVLARDATEPVHHEGNRVVRLLGKVGSGGQRK